MPLPKRTYPYSTIPLPERDPNSVGPVRSKARGSALNLGPRLPPLRNPRIDLRAPTLDPKSRPLNRMPPSQQDHTYTYHDPPRYAPTSILRRPPAHGLGFHLRRRVQSPTRHAHSRRSPNHSRSPAHPTTNRGDQLPGDDFFEPTDAPAPDRLT